MAGDVQTVIEIIEASRQKMLKVAESMKECLDNLQATKTVAKSDIPLWPGEPTEAFEHENTSLIEREAALLGESIRNLSTASDLAHNVLQQFVGSLNQSSCSNADPRSNSIRTTESRWPLLAEEYKRYGRQLILPEIGIEGQLRLKNASILIIGVGGLGCPAAAYLAGAGVGRIGLVDGDKVEESNLHRQILHNSSKIGMSKVDSAFEYLRQLNPFISLDTHPETISPTTAPTLIKPYDVVLDCTDNPATRYLISDVCILLQRPLVSASALRTDGQLMVLNHPALPPGSSPGGPCYRCIFPKPPPVESVVTCSEGGILGPVVGVMGVLQALEAIKLIASGALSLPHRGKSGTTVPKEEERQPKPQPTLLTFSATSNPPFRQIRLRGRRKDCAVCSSTASVTLETLASGSTDYIQFCGVNLPSTLLPPSFRISASEYAQRYLFALTTSSKISKYNVSRTENTAMEGNVTRKEPILLDIRPTTHYNLYSIPGSHNMPYTTLSRFTPSTLPALLAPIDSQDDSNHNPQYNTPTPRRNNQPIHIICARGNDSQHAVLKLKSLGLDMSGTRYIGDVEGGWKALRREIKGTQVDGKEDEGGHGGKNWWPDI